MGVGISVIPLPTFGTLFFLVGYLAQAQSEGFCLILLHRVLSYLAVISWERSIQVTAYLNQIDVTHVLF